MRAPLSPPSIVVSTAQSKSMDTLGLVLRICISCSKVVAHHLSEPASCCDSMSLQHRYHRLGAPTQYALAPAKHRPTQADLIESP
jgi:hypothetical protein